MPHIAQLPSLCMASSLEPYNTIYAYGSERGVSWSETQEEVDGAR